MLNDSVQEQLNYSMILLKHLDRISVLTTLIREDDPNMNLSDMGRRMALMQSIYSLKALIPSSLKDVQYFADEEQEQKRYTEALEKIKEGDDQKKVSVFEFYHRFRQLGIIIDLLNRKGMLLSSQMPARKKAKPNKTEEVWNGN